MHRIDEICNHNGQMEDVYSEFNKWSFVSGWVGFFCLFVLFFLFLPENSKHFVSAETFQLKCDQ